MTGPQIVGQWINMEHYFSTVDQEIYGSGSKIYHNVVGRLGIMSGPQSDLRTGLAWQTVMNGPRPYHEPMRLLTVIEAPREQNRPRSSATNVTFSGSMTTNGCASWPSSLEKQVMLSLYSGQGWSGSDSTDPITTQKTPLKGA